MRPPFHIWRTEKGELVPHGHKDAHQLAYPAGVEINKIELEVAGKPTALAAVLPELVKEHKAMVAAAAKAQAEAIKESHGRGVGGFHLSGAENRDKRVVTETPSKR